MKKMYAVALCFIAWGSVGFSTQDREIIQKNIDRGFQRQAVERNFLASEMAKQSGCTGLFFEQRIKFFLKSLKHEEDKRVEISRKSFIEWGNACRALS